MKFISRQYFNRCNFTVWALVWNVLVAFHTTTLVAQTYIKDEQESMSANIANDEVIQFFRTVAVFDDAARTWRIPIHAWVYEPQKSRFRKAMFSWAINAKYNLKINDDAQPFYDRRLNLLIADNERGKSPAITIAGQTMSLTTSAANGHIQTEIELDEALVEAAKKGKILPFKSIARDGREFQGEVQLVATQGLSVISDIDDTIKISNVLDHQRLVDNTFLKAFNVVPGMSEAYQRLADQVDSFHFVSSSPWQLYAPLQEFVDAADFPWATFSLKSVRFRDMTLFDLFKPGTATKPAQIAKILYQFPRRNFILIGDSGEQDPEVYAQVFKTYPGRIKRIFIRNITDEAINNPRFQSLVREPSAWVLFEDPADIRL